MVLFWLCFSAYIQYQKGEWPCYATNPALRIQELIQPNWSLSTGEWIPIKQHSVLSDTAMAWPTQPSPISCWHVSETQPNTALFFGVVFYESNLYDKDQRDNNKACTCFTDMKLDKFPVLRYNLKEHISQWLKIKLYADTTAEIVRDWNERLGNFFRIRKTKLYTAQKRKDAAKN